MHSVLILEPNHGGHNATYLRWIVEAFLDGGVEVRVATLKDGYDDDCHMQCLARDLGSQIDLMVFDRHMDPELHTSDLGTRQVARREKQYYQLFAELYRTTKRHPQDPVFVPYLDYMAYAVALASSPFDAAPWGGIVMRPAFHFHNMGVEAPRVGWSRVKQLLFTRLLHATRLETLFSIDSTLVEYYQLRHPEISRQRLRLLPEPGEVNGSSSRASAREQLGIPSEAHVILVYGQLRSRKGIDALIAATESPDFPKNTHVLLAGTQHPEIVQLLVSPPAKRLSNEGRVHVDNRVLAGEDEHRVFAAADLVWVGYRNHYAMSAVLIQAGKMKLPVIACRDGLLGKLTRDGDLGAVVDTENSANIAQAVARLSTNDAAARKHGENGAAFFADRDVESFKSTIRDNFQPSRDTVVA